MNKNKKIALLIFLCSAIVFGFLTGAGPVSADGLSIDVQTERPNTRYVDDGAEGWHGESVYKTTGNLEYFTGAPQTLVEAFPLMRKDWDELYKTHIRATGAIFLATPGRYWFSYGSNGTGTWANISIYENGKTDAVCRVPKVDDPATPENEAEPASLACNYSAGHLFAAGWHQISVTAVPADWSMDPQIRLLWKKDLYANPYAIIPRAMLDPVTWDEDEISIPSVGMEQINYKIAGVGAEGLSSAELEFDLPSGITAGDILDGGTRLFWRNEGSSETLQVRNADAPGDPVRIIAGTRMQTSMGTELESVIAELPNDFFDNSAGESRVYLSFPSLSGVDEIGGIALVVVYKDTTQPNGVLKIKTLGGGVHGAAAHPVNFDITSRDPVVPLRPFFLFEDAESKKLLTSGMGLPRHNYMAMKYGSGSMPAESDLFFDAASGIDTALEETSNPVLRRIIPQADGVPDLTRTDRWYPMFGREGPQIDVLSTAGNYAPNKRNNSNNAYITTDQSDGVFMDSLTIPAGNTWVSFQYAASDFYGDTAAPLNSNESSHFTAAGLLYYDTRKLVICPSGGALNIGQKQQFNVYYWNDRPGGLPACSDMGTWDPAAYAEVTNLSTWSVGNNNIKLTFLTGGSVGEIEGVAVGDSTVTATYNGLKATANVTVYDLCSSAACNSTNGKCETTLSSPPCSSSCTTDDQCSSNSNSPRSWREVAP